MSELAKLPPCLEGLIDDNVCLIETPPNGKRGRLSLAVVGVRPDLHGIVTCRLLSFNVESVTYSAALGSEPNGAAFYIEEILVADGKIALGHDLEEMEELSIRFELSNVDAGRWAETRVALPADENVPSYSSLASIYEKDIQWRDVTLK